MTTTKLSHPSIGEVTGTRGEEQDVARFQGLTYATLRDRFAPAVLQDKYPPHTVVDGTKLGPSVLSHSIGPDFEAEVLLQHALVYDKSTQYTSNLEGLNLSVFVPTGTDGQIDGNKRLPVMAFIYGGGYKTGSSAWPQYDMARLVELSSNMGKPVIAVTLNYRLNSPGWLTSKELREAGYQVNNGLRDQRTALLWIQKHIAGFGGDPENVTLVGQSAGSVSVNYLLHSKEPLFRRCILMSGTYIPKPPSSLDHAEAVYARAMKALGLEEATAEERIRALNSIDGQELCTLHAHIPAHPYVDDDIINFDPTFENITNGSLPIPGARWCESIMLGDCQLDGNIQGLLLMNRTRGLAAAFSSSILELLGEDVGQRLLSAYNLHPDVADEEALFHIMEICSDVDFFAPTLALAKNLSEKSSVYIYRFNEGNPWPGKFKGQAIHVQDLTWLFQNYNDFLDGAQRKQAVEFGSDIISFMNGEQPWAPWTSERPTARVIGPNGDIDVVEDTPPLNARKEIVLKLAGEVGMDKLNWALNSFMDGDVKT